MLFDPFRIGGEQADRAIIGREMPRIAALAMLEHRDMRHRTQPRQLAQFGRDIGHEEGGAGLRKPPRNRGKGIGNRRPAERGAVNRLGHRERCHGGRFLPGGFEQRGDFPNFDSLVERGEDIVPRAEQRHAARPDQFIGDRCRALGMAAPLVMDEIADGSGHAHAEILVSRRSRSRCARCCARMPSSVPAAWLRRAR